MVLDGHAYLWRKVHGAGVDRSSNGSVATVVLQAVGMLGPLSLGSRVVVGVFPSQMVAYVDRDHSLLLRVRLCGPVRGPILFLFSMFAVIPRARSLCKAKLPIQLCIPLPVPRRRWKLDLSHRRSTQALPPASGGSPAFAAERQLLLALHAFLGARHPIPLLLDGRIGVLLRLDPQLPALLLRGLRLLRLLPLLLLRLVQGQLAVHDEGAGLLGQGRRLIDELHARVVRVH